MDGYGRIIMTVEQVMEHIRKTYGCDIHDVVKNVYNNFISLYDDDDDEVVIPRPKDVTAIIFGTMFIYDHINKTDLYKFTQSHCVHSY